jgi:hypothetical protein
MEPLEASPKSQFQAPGQGSLRACIPNITREANPDNRVLLKCGLWQRRR